MLSLALARCLVSGEPSAQKGVVSAPTSSRVSSLNIGSCVVWRSKYGSRHSIQSNSSVNLRRYASGVSDSSNGSLVALYSDKVKRGKLRHDKCQENTIYRLDPLSSVMVKYEEEYLAGGYPSKIAMPSAMSNKQESRSMWSLLQEKVSMFNVGEVSVNVEPLEAPKGFYMYGDVGSGKTMLMDLFLEATPLQFKQRVHFNSFMIDFHNSLHRWRQTPQAKGQKQSVAIESIADAILAKSPLLCFDEFQVTNIADAMILNRLFNTLWHKGAVVIATSNRPPEDLYKGGLQRENFVPFIHQMNEKCLVHDIGSTMDYRLMGERATNIWNEKSKNPLAIQEIWDNLTEKRVGEPMELRLDTRKILVPKAIKGIAMFGFNDLCAKPLGAADYALLAREFHTLLLTDIPVMNLDQKDLVRRFITLIDELYEHRVKVICSADAQLKDIFPYSIDNSMRSSKTLIAGEEEIFAFSRTLSRLSEMQTSEYLQSHHIIDPSIRNQL